MTVIRDFLVSSFLCVRQYLEVVSYTDLKHMGAGDKLVA